ncbi:hypothetical protein JXB22_07170 [candidate division WOR-3 bacterium]|nr:hypothetical protein [candidate division WOR-3 bacterium]
MVQDHSYHDDILLIPVDWEVCYSDYDGKLDESIKKQQISYLKKLEPLLRQVLRSQEKVVYVVRCQWPRAILDVLTSGWLAYFMNQAMIILTSERIIFLRIRSNNVPAGSLSQVAYGDIAAYKRVGFGQSVLFTYASGRMERFSSMQPKISKKLIRVLSTRVPGDHSADQGHRHYLCPRCTSTLLEGRYTCPNCNLQFKDPSTVLKYGLLLPGGGFFYMRKKFFAFQYAVSELLLIGFLIIALFSMAEDPALVGLGITAAILLIVTKTIHVFRARSYAHEYVPVQKDNSALHHS